MARFSVSVTLIIDTNEAVTTRFGDPTGERLMDDMIAHLVKRADEFAGHGGDVTASHGSWRVYPAHENIETR